jgi:hypothetical protein
MNLLHPLTFEPVEAARFALRHRCALCLASLVADGEHINCPECGVMYEHTVIKVGKAEAIQSDRVGYGRELRPKSDKSETDILKELGFDE